jgi:hypothetical protein
MRRDGAGGETAIDLDQEVKRNRIEGDFCWIEMVFSG